LLLDLLVCRGSSDAALYSTRNGAQLMYALSGGRREAV
jgi:hypothetical protein